MCRESDFVDKHMQHKIPFEEHISMSSLTPQCNTMSVDTVHDVNANRTLFSELGDSQFTIHNTLNEAHLKTFELLLCGCVSFIVKH